MRVKSYLDCEALPVPIRVSLSPRIAPAFLRFVFSSACHLSASTTVGKAESRWEFRCARLEKVTVYLLISLAFVGCLVVMVLFYENIFVNSLVFKSLFDKYRGW